MKKLCTPKTPVELRNDRLKFREDTLRRYIQEIEKELTEYNKKVFPTESAAKDTAKSQTLQLLQDRISELFNQGGVYRY